MPLSELWRLAAGKLESGQQRPCPNDISLPSENDLVELVWENGQIAMQNQSRRCSGSLALNGLPPNTSRIRDSVPSNTSRIGKFGGVESILDEMSSVVPSGELDLGQDDEIIPWLNYPIGDALPHDYMSDLLPEISGVTANALSTQNSFAAMDKRSGNCHGSTSKSSSSKVCLINSWPTQHRQTTDPLVSGVSNTTSIGNTNSHSGTMFRNAAKGKDAVKEAGSMDTVRSNVGIPSSNSNVMNFPYFSRPATLVKASIPNSEGIPNLISSEAGRTEVKLLDRSNSMQKNVDFRGAASSSKIAVNLGKEPPSKNDKPVISANVVNPMKGVVDGDRNVEPMVVSSSVGSGNSADEQTHNSSKRKFHDIEESECRSDDIDTVSIGATKLASVRGGNGSKRSRAAEVHNLSERRRRDRINEKMRALQELIPNCNKVDKASMLDEAIEYLKTLQLQVQIMSMGAGLYMPPMMFPTMRPPHVPHFAPMGVGVGMGMGMGMGLGFGISMPDANGASPSYPIFSVPPMHFASPGTANFPRIPAPSAPVYRHPSHSSVLHPPLAPVTGQPLVTTSAMGITAGSSGKHNNKSNELQAKNEVLDQSATGQEDKSATNDPAPSSLTSATETGTNRETG